MVVVCRVQNRNVPLVQCLTCRRELAVDLVGHGKATSTCTAVLNAPQAHKA
jgi:hypothetical protein